MVIPLLAGALLVGGCGTGHEDDVRHRAGAFETAVAASDWERACDQLAPGTRDELAQDAGGSCAKALADEQLDPPGRPGSVQVFGGTAQVRYAADTLFLSRFADGWRVVAAGCTAQRPRPYDCRVEGG
ncbi:hypothetical protein [Nocardioides alcanivorans]|uniref:hypothetical protein n=1 Tax=Nocardioides alcanivorans TaxID=2897352 RepID=UPI001F23F8AA|nr:hypothetical protein [Nocardioides alcanivorans]